MLISSIVMIISQCMQVSKYLHTLNTHNFCQLYLRKSGEDKNVLHPNITPSVNCRSDSPAWPWPSLFTHLCCELPSLFQENAYRFFFSKCFHKLLKPSFFSWVWSLVLIYKGLENFNLWIRLWINYYFMPVDQQLLPEIAVQHCHAKMCTIDIYNRMIYLPSSLDLCPGPFWVPGQIQCLFEYLSSRIACVHSFK